MANGAPKHVAIIKGKAVEERNTPCSCKQPAAFCGADLNTNAARQPFLPNDWVFLLSECRVVHLISINQPYRSPYTAIVARKIDAIYYVYMIGLLNAEFSILCIFPSASAFPKEAILCFPRRFDIANKSILHSSPSLEKRVRKLNFGTPKLVFPLKCAEKVLTKELIFKVMC